MTTRLGLLLGDACGIGPEIVARLLASETLAPEVQTVIIGDPRVLTRGASIVGAALDLPVLETPDELDGDQRSPMLLQGPEIAPEDAPIGRVSQKAGLAVLDTFRFALGLARQGALQAICYAPCNKQAMHLAGMGFEDELRFFAHVLDHDGYVGEINATDELATTRVTSHVPLRAVADLITTDAVVAAIRLADQTLHAAGMPRPRIGVCGLNPHAGEGGIFGREEIDVIAPAVERAKTLQIAASGPYPSDTVFVRARDGELDGVVTMYHDQGQIAMKLMGFERGVTILAGLPVPIATPAHGTAFDIAGKGIARVDALENAYRTAARMALSKEGN